MSWNRHKVWLRASLEYRVHGFSCLAVLPFVTAIMIPGHVLRECPQVLPVLTQNKHKHKVRQNVSRQSFWCVKSSDLLDVFGQAQIVGRAQLRPIRAHCSGSSIFLPFHTHTLCPVINLCSPKKDTETDFININSHSLNGT